jgi:hypothetical protein
MCLLGNFLFYFISIKFISISLYQISAMYGKAITHLVRLSGILQALENANLVVLSLPKVCRHTINENLKMEIDESLKENRANLNSHFISSETLLRGKNMVEYFILHRLIMANYPCEISDKSNSQKIESIINNLINFENHGTDLEIIKNILLFRGSSIHCKDFLAKYKKLNAKKVIETFNYLEKRDMGNFSEVKNSKGPTKKIFKKICIENVKELQKLKLLEYFGVSFEDYSKNFDFEKLGKHTFSVFFC